MQNTKLLFKNNKTKQKIEKWLESSKEGNNKTILEGLEYFGGLEKRRTMASGSSWRLGGLLEILE